MSWVFVAIVFLFFVWGGFVGVVACQEGYRDGLKDGSSKGRMTEGKARWLLRKHLDPDGGMGGKGEPDMPVTWDASWLDDYCLLRSGFTADELEAIAWWMRNKGVKG